MLIMSLTHSQQDAISLLIQGISLPDIAQKADISLSKLSHWLNSDPDFLKELHQATITASIVNQLSVLPLQQQALQVLQTVLADENTRPQVRVSVARLVLEQSKELATTALAGELTAIRRELEQAKQLELPLLEGEVIGEN